MGDEWLRSEERYRDFRMTLAFRVPAGGNSGVHLRCTDRLLGRGNGMEVQIMDEDGERVRDVPAKCRTGSIWSVVGPLKAATRGLGQ